MNKHTWKIYGLWILLSEAVGGLSGWLTRDGVKIYSQSIVQPPLSPPNWVFPVVWSVLYLLMALAATLVVGSNASGEAKRNALLWYGVNLLLNFSWTPVFFGLKQPLAAFVVLLLLIMVTVIVLVSFYKIRPAAGYLLIPYLAWLIFAGYLNFGIYLLNR